MISEAVDMQKKVATDNGGNGKVKQKILGCLKGVSVFEAEAILYEITKLIKKNTVI
jgi:hypothetical protein